MQVGPFRDDIVEAGRSEYPAAARPEQVTFQELRTAVLPLELQVSGAAWNAAFGAALTYVQFPQRRLKSVLATATATATATTSDATVWSKPSTVTATVNSVEV